MTVRIKIALDFICFFLPVKMIDYFYEQLANSVNQGFLLFVCFLKIQHFLGCPDRIGMMYPATP